MWSLFGIEWSAAKITFSGIVVVVVLRGQRQRRLGNRVDEKRKHTNEKRCFNDDLRSAVVRQRRSRQTSLSLWCGGPFLEKAILTGSESDLNEVERVPKQPKQKGVRPQLRPF